MVSALTVISTGNQEIQTVSGTGPPSVQNCGMKTLSAATWASLCRRHITSVVQTETTPSA